MNCKEINIKKKVLQTKKKRKEEKGEKISRNLAREKGTIFFPTFVCFYTASGDSTSPLAHRMKRFAFSPRQQPPPLSMVVSCVCSSSMHACCCMAFRTLFFLQLRKRPPPPHNNNSLFFFYEQKI